jgi:FKBP-type peptidyl-prolyl cis-trans isomerase FkpA
MPLLSRAGGFSGLFAMFVPVFMLSACGGDTGSGTAPAAPSFTQTDLRVGSGAEAVTGRGVRVNYTGWLYDPSKPEQKGQQFDSSVGGEPFEFMLGSGQVIPGWDRGVAGMKVGGQRRLIIPPDLAYGATGAGGVIPPNATLVFDVELLDVQS